MGSGATPGSPIADLKRNDRARDEVLPVEDIRQELIDSRLRIDSLRLELQRAENEIFKVARLWDVLIREEFSYQKLAKVAYLAGSCIIPDMAKWFLRPLTRRLRQQLRRFQHVNKVAAYQVNVQPAGQQQKRVLHAIANFMTGGSSRLVVDIIEGLGAAYRQEILTGFIPFPAAYQGVTICECRSQHEILAFLEQFRPDVLHVHYWGDVDFWWYDKVFNAAEKLGCPIVENINTPVVPYRSQVVRRYVYVSEYVMQEFGRSGEPAVVIHPGSDLEYYSRKDLSVIPDNCIGMVYRLEIDKLNLESIDVFVEVAKRRPETKILIVGGGSFLEEYKQTVFANGVASSFCFTGAVSYAALPNLYAQMSLFVAPVWKESFGQVSVFAMSMGIPVVGYRVGGLAEIVADDELLAPVGDSEQLASVILKLLDDREKRRAIGAESQLRVKSLFSVETMTQRYETLYRSVISESA